MNSISGSSTDHKTMTRDQILALSVARKIQYFKGIVVQHPHMASALEDVLTLATPHSGSNIIFLMGPTGVGKSATILTAEQQMIREYYSEIEADPSFIPIVVVEAPETGEKAFSWRILYENIGEKLQEPLIEKKAATMIEDERSRMLVSSRGPTVGALRNAVGKSLKTRRTLARPLVYSFSWL
jgi:hypothetical protein